ncbi:MAG: 1-deoxy-D-xylulose-5-phosphate synthase [Acidobacteriota bacterium]
MSVLDKVNFPEDLKKLKYNELKELSGEIRELIIEVVSKNGGHLSSNLGAVELTIALHKVFSAPEDKFIWDVGHQCYTHKILTGRKDRIFSIRKKGGLIGFPDIDESKYDVLNTGHASTSLAFASGMAIARDRKGESFNVIPVIGDGALTGGVAFEALNNIGHIKQKMVIVLNDNKMSISPNVGGISKYLNYLSTGRPYIRLKEIIQSIFNKIPIIGKSLVTGTRKLLKLLRVMTVPGSLFNDLGVKYIGPVNGHDLKEMIKVFEESKKYDFPVLLHIVTEKGLGYDPAVENPSSFHSSAPFEISNGKFIKKGAIPSYSSVFGKAVLDIVEKDRSVIALTAAMPSGTGLDQVQEKYPDNFFDVGIAEQYMLDFAGGLALGGIKPVVGIYSTFLQRAVDQVIHDLTLMKIPVVVGIDRAGLVGDDGPTHQGIYDISILRPLPGVVLMAPKDENELRQMIYSGLKYRKPVFIRFPKEPGRGVEIKEEFEEIPLGKGEVMREGSDGVIIAAGTLAYNACEAADKLYNEDNIDLRVINPRFIKPLDSELILNSIGKNSRVVTIEDGVKKGGFNSDIREIINTGNAGNCDILPLGVPSEIIDVASRDELLEKYGLDSEGIFKNVRKFMKKNEK